jgi:predicted outer membrane protein
MTGKSNRQQLQLAQLAVKRAQNPQVKTLAQSLVQEYTASGKSLTRLNKTLGFKAPNTDEAGPDATYTRLSALSGAAFDSAFLQAVQRSQATDLSRVQAASTFAGTKALKSYLNSTLPAMRTSAGRVDQLSVATGGTAASPTTGPTTTGVVPGTNPPAIPVPSPPPATPGSTSPTVPGNPQPGTQQPGTQQPGTQQPGTQQPGTQQPGTQQPGARQPGTRQPGNAPRPAAPPARPGSGSGGAPAPAPPAR